MKSPKQKYLKRVKVVNDSFIKKQDHQKAPKTKHKKSIALKVFKEKKRVCLHCGSAVIKNFIFCSVCHFESWNALNPNNGRIF